MNLVDFLFPKRCVYCQKPGSYFCPECLKEAPILDRQICCVCKKEAIFGMTHPSCKTRYVLDGVSSVFLYYGLIKKGISSLKYKFTFSLKEELASKTIRAMEENKKDFTALIRLINEKRPVLVSVPLHKTRFRWRGFNQASILGKLFAQKWHLLFSDKLLVRIKSTTPQIKLERKKRLVNIKNAFIINPKIYRERDKFIHYPILLFDDVFTTGATLNECAKTLKMTGFKKVWGLTLARS